MELARCRTLEDCQGKEFVKRIKRLNAAAGILVLGTYLITGPCFGMDIGPKAQITKHGDDFNLTLTPPMAEALRQWNAGFTPWETADYTPDVQKDETRKSGEAPFALIGDFNHDGKADVILDGHDAKQELTIGIISQGSGYYVTALREIPLGSSKPLPYFLQLGRHDGGKTVLTDQLTISFPQSDESEGGICTYKLDGHPFKEDCQTL